MDEKSNLFKVCVMQYGHASVANMNIANFALILQGRQSPNLHKFSVLIQYICNELIIKFSFLACASIKTNLNVLNLKFFTTILEIVTVFYKI